MANISRGISKEALFENTDACHPVRNQMPGNAVRFGDGYATVTDYKLPMPLTQVGKAEARPSPMSQDTGLFVLVVDEER